MSIFRLVYHKVPKRSKYMPFEGLKRCTTATRIHLGWQYLLAFAEKKVNKKYAFTIINCP